MVCALGRGGGRTARPGPAYPPGPAYRLGLASQPSEHVAVLAPCVVVLAVSWARRRAGCWPRPRCAVRVGVGEWGVGGALGACLRLVLSLSSVRRRHPAQLAGLS